MALEKIKNSITRLYLELELKKIKGAVFRNAALPDDLSRAIDVYVESIYGKRVNVRDKALRTLGQAFRMHHRAPVSEAVKRNLNDLVDYTLATTPLMGYPKQLQDLAANGWGNFSILLVDSHGRHTPLATHRIGPPRKKTDWIVCPQGNEHERMNNLIYELTYTSRFMTRPKPGNATITPADYFPGAGELVVRPLKRPIEAKLAPRDMFAITRSQGFRLVVIEVTKNAGAASHGAAATARTTRAAKTGQAAAQATSQSTEPQTLRFAFHLPPGELPTSVILQRKDRGLMREFLRARPRPAG